MAALISLDEIDLLPVVELEPAKFTTRERPLPAGSFRDVPAEWPRYWLDSLGDSGVVGLTPLRPGSWHLTTRQLTNPATLARILDVIVRDWGGPEALADPDGRPVLCGGPALCSGATC